jgi:hypothetical protein
LPQEEKKMKKKNDTEYEYVPKLKVFCDGCNDFHPTDEVITENIESDYMGRDVVTFECKVDGKFHKGIVIS